MMAASDAHFPGQGYLDAVDHGVDALPRHDQVCDPGEDTEPLMRGVSVLPHTEAALRDELALLTGFGAGRIAAVATDDGFDLHRHVGGEEVGSADGQELEPVVSALHQQGCVVCRDTGEDTARCLMLHDQGVLVFDVAPSPQAATHATSHFSYPPTPPGVAPACAVTRSVELRRVRGCGMRLAQLAGRLRGQLADAAAPSPAPPRGGWLGPPSEPPLQDAALPAVDLPPKEGAVRCGAVRQEVAAAVLRGRASINALLLASSLSQHRCRESRYASASMAMWAVDPHRGELALDPDTLRTSLGALLSMCGDRDPDTVLCALEATTRLLANAPAPTAAAPPEWVSPELRAQLAVAAAPTADAHSSSWGQAEQAAHARALRALRALLAPLLPACT